MLEITNKKKKIKKGIKTFLENRNLIKKFFNERENKKGTYSRKQYKNFREMSIFHA